MKSKTQLAQIRRQLRADVPKANRKHYEILWEDFLRLVTPDNYDTLKHIVWDKIKWIQSCTEAWKVPPPLIRGSDEPADDYLDRCWQAWNY